MGRFSFFQSLSNLAFARLYLAQSINLLGDAFTWLGLALLAWELAGDKSPQVLATALTLRVTAFVLIAPIAGVMADRFDRKTIMVVAQLCRMLLVGILPFITQIWQVYVVVLSLNVFNACFAPTYKATIPQITGQERYSQAIALSGTTYQVLSMLGPTIAGIIAAWLGARQLFLIDAASFLLAAVLISSLPGKLQVAPNSIKAVDRILPDIRIGTVHLLGDGALRYALALQLVTAIAGAQILVNTIGYITSTLNSGNVEYGWVMAALGSGATLATLLVSRFERLYDRTTVVLAGAGIITLAIMPAGSAGLWQLMLLWTIAGIGQSLVDLPTQMLIADRVSVDLQGRVYGAHFAWSHLWWAIAYPLAGWLGVQCGSNAFLISSLIGLGLLATIQFCLAPRWQFNMQSRHSSSISTTASIPFADHSHTHQHLAITHQHEHSHNEHHHPHYWRWWLNSKSHNHIHYHPPLAHTHVHHDESHHHHEHSF